jgi:hypothetical protein
MSVLRWLPAAAAPALLAAACVATAQPPPPAPAERSARAAAPVDLTGHWVAQVTEDWRWRMLTPPKGDYASVPLNAAGRAAADSWDLERDLEAGEECRAFGAGGLLRQPTRLRIEWADDDTLRLETDAGEQTRLFHFGQPPPAAGRSWQGSSVAEWLGLPPVIGFPPIGPAVAPSSTARGGAAGPPPGGGGGGPPRAARDASLKVVTTNLRSGYLRKNGVPYSEEAVVTEYFDRVSIFGNDYLQVVTVVVDPKYLAAPFTVSNHFKREADGSKWRPTPCATDAPVGTFQAPPSLP